MRPDAPDSLTVYLQALTQDGRLGPPSTIQTFVEPRVQASADGVTRGALEVLRDESRMLLLGGPWTGKTTTLEVVVHHLAQEYLDSRSRVCPIFVAASALSSPPDGAPWMWLATAAARLTDGDHHTADMLAAALHAGEAHLFIDGLDEIHDAAERFRVVHTLCSLPIRSPRLKLCISTRPEDTESATLHGHFAVWSLLPFDAAQAQHLISVRTALRASDIAHQLAQAPLLGSLAGNPLVLHLLALYSADHRFELPRSRAQLFEDLTDALLARERQKVPQPVPTRVVHRGHEIIAEAMARSGTSSLPKAELHATLTDDAEGLFSTEDRDRFLRYALERVLLLVEPAPDRVQFAHRSFHEFYLGRALAHDITVLDHLPPGDLSEALVFAAGLTWDPVPIITAAYQRHGIALAVRCCAELQQDRRMVRRYLVGLVLNDLGEDFRQLLIDVLRPRSTPLEDSPEPPKQALFDQLSEMWTALPRKGASADARGRGLEQFAVTLLEAYFEVVDVRRRHQVGEVDVVCENTHSDPFWANYSGDIWVECKNTEAKATIEQVNTFVGKLVGSRCKLGFFFSVAGFTKDAMDRLKNVGNNPSIPLIAPISGNDIEDLLLHRTELQRFFKARIRSVV